MDIVPITQRKQMYRYSRNIEFNYCCCNNSSGFEGNLQPRDFWSNGTQCPGRMVLNVVPESRADRRKIDSN